MAGIALSSGVRQALSSIQSTASQQSQIQNRLATGKKVNSALDNPSSFFTASGLSNRAGDLSSLLDDMGQAVKTLEAADKAITAIGKLVDNAKSIAKQAQAAPADVTGVTGVAATVTGSNISSGSAGDIQITAGGKTFTTTLVAGDDTATEVATKIQAAADAAGANFKAEVSGSALKLSSTDTTGNESFTIAAGGSGSTAGTLTAAGLTAATTTGTKQVEASTKRADLKKDLDGIVAQINELAGDAGYNGVNLVTGDNLKVAFNETGKSKLDIAGKNLKADGLGIDSLTLATNANIESSLTKLKAATDTLRSQAATFGANLSVVQNRQDFTKGMIDTLNNGSDQLTLADPNEEGAKLLSLNTRAQLAGTALSLASQQDQAVLRLF